MTLSRSDFGGFFALVNRGHRPYAWQERLLDHVLDRGQWPEVIAAPTGAGKSNVVDVHIFANALFAAGSGPRVPRRLMTVVGRRALVDNQADRAQSIRSVLNTSDERVAVDVREALISLVHGAADPSFLMLAQLRGGLPPDSTWLDDPRACAVITATPDMWGSRLLMRGYGSTRAARPREAGLLAHDSVLVLDEAHLNRQLLLTARTIATWTGLSAEVIGVPGLQVVETTATPTSRSSAVVGVRASDLADDSKLAVRLTSPKPFRLVESPAFATTGGPDRRHITLLTQLVLDLRQQAREGIVGCVVNRVETATQVTAELRKNGLRAACWVGRMRPMDIQALRRDHSDLFDPTVSKTLDVIVATQTIEVGVDVDLAALVTELAPGSALAQRAGRVNRWGERESGPIVVVTPGNGDIADYPPYSGSDLADALHWATSLLQAGATLSPWDIANSPPPEQHPKRSFLKRPELHDALRWAVTSTPMATEESLELWLRDSLDPDDDPVGFVLRAPMPSDDSSALALLSATLPADEEVFPASLAVSRMVTQRVMAGKAGSDARVFLYRDEALSLIEPTQHLRPGDIYIVSASNRITREGVVVADPSESGETVSTTWGAGTTVVFPGDPFDHLLEEPSAADPELVQARVDQEFGKATYQVITPPRELSGESLPWLVLRTTQAANASEDDRQTWSIRSRVSLASHSNAVRDRASRMAHDVGVAPSIGESLAVAAQHHDAGKEDQRFQVLLGNRESQPAAKSGFLNIQQARRAAARAGLPVGWRHEHRSACLVWRELEGHPSRDLVVRLVGTSHGHGRGVAQDSVTTLSTDADSPALVADARFLFDEGEWEDLLLRTEAEFGVWGCAYLEAILRASDCQVSKEGS